MRCPGHSGQNALDVFPCVLGHAAGYEEDVVVLQRQVGGLGGQDLLQDRWDLLASLRRGADELGRSLGRRVIRALGQRDCCRIVSCPSWSMGKPPGRATSPTT